MIMHTAHIALESKVIEYSLFTNNCIEGFNSRGSSLFIAKNTAKEGSSQAADQ